MDTGKTKHTPIGQKLIDAVISRITADAAKMLMVELARIPSPLTPMMEAEPKLREFIDTAVEPRLRDSGAKICRDRMGNLLATLGTNESGRSLMLVTNAMTQPAATMPNPFGGEVRDGRDYGLPGEVVLGKGVSEQKAPLAAILLALRAIVACNVTIRGRLAFLCCVSGETGRHDAIGCILESTGARAEMAILNGTGNRISLGNRGRVDITIIVHGSAAHSSRPNTGCNAITGAIEALRRVTEGVRLTPHARLGPATLAVNRISSFPGSTHTIQDRCEISLDRRLLPGEDPDAAVAEIAALVQPVNDAVDPASGQRWRVEILKGAFMYPSLVAETSDVVQAISRASRSILGVVPETYYQSNAFDQGYLNHVGIEACCFGPGEAQYAHTDLDMASVDRTRDASKVFAGLILQRLT